MKRDGWMLTVGIPVLVVRKVILHEGTVSLCTGGRYGVLTGKPSFART